MEKDHPRTSSPLLGLLCTVFGHDYIILSKTSNHQSEFQCVWCQKKVSNVYLENLKSLRCRLDEFKKNISLFF